RKDSRRSVKLASQAGALEREIASLLLTVDSRDEAVINLVSAGSCFLDARRNVEALRAFREALTLNPPEPLRAFLESQLKKLSAVAVPGSIFGTSQAMVRGNN